MFLNKVHLIGNLTRDPELKALPTGDKVCTFSMATNETYKDKNGAKQEKVEFHNIVVWGKTAENVATYMKKGSQIYVEGKLQTRSWDDTATNTKKYRTEILAVSVQFGSKPQGSSSAPAKEKSGYDNMNGADDKIEFPDDGIDPADIPF